MYGRWFKYIISFTRLQKELVDFFYRQGNGNLEKQTIFATFPLLSPFTSYQFHLAVCLLEKNHKVTQVYTEYDQVKLSLCTDKR